MISFYPGPSQVYASIPRYVKEAHKEGLLGINHRSETFMELVARVDKLLKEKLEVPHDYMVFFTSSATECWEIIAQSLFEGQSYHFYNGAFGEKWYQYTRRLRPLAIGYQFDREKMICPETTDLSSIPGLICFTHNETSNGTALNNETLSSFRNTYPDHIIAVDATSSMAGVALDFSTADVWYASVQKCFGLPAGMAVMICSPRAIEKSLDLNEKAHYNSLTSLIDKMKDWQTSYTPNVLYIYLLMRVMHDAKPIRVVEKKLCERAEKWYETLASLKKVQLLVKNDEVRSNTVIAVEASEKTVSDIKQKALKEGFLLGNGYGVLKDNTFRIANFPALRNKEVGQLRNFLMKHLK